ARFLHGAGYTILDPPPLSLLDLCMKNVYPPDFARKHYPNATTPRLPDLPSVVHPPILTWRLRLLPEIPTRFQFHSNLAASILPPNIFYNPKNYPSGTRPHVPNPPLSAAIPQEHDLDIADKSTR